MTTYEQHILENQFTIGFLIDFQSQQFKLAKMQKINTFNNNQKMFEQEPPQGKLTTLNSLN